MRKTDIQHSKGFSLVELMVAISIIMVLALTAVGYRYYSTMDVRKSEVQTNGARIALSLLESWKGLGGRLDYDPEDDIGTLMVVSASADGPAVDAGLIELNSYKIFLDGVYYYATLGYKEATGTEPRVLNVSVAWLADYAEGAVSATDRTVSLATYSGNS